MFILSMPITTSSRCMPAWPSETWRKLGRFIWPSLLSFASCYIPTSTISAFEPITRIFCCVSPSARLSSIYSRCLSDRAKKQAAIKKVRPEPHAGFWGLGDSLCICCVMKPTFRSRFELNEIWWFWNSGLMMAVLWDITSLTLWDLFWSKNLGIVHIFVGHQVPSAIESGIWVDFYPCLLRYLSSFSFNCRYRYELLSICFENLFCAWIFISILQFFVSFVIKIGKNRVQKWSLIIYVLIFFLKGQLCNFFNGP
jgi:hypothetical protein